jgi:hypothetical protein
MRKPTQEELEALTTELNARLREHLPDTPGYQATLSWHHIELARLYGRTVTLLADPPPPIAGIVPRLDPIPIEHRHQAWNALAEGNVRAFIFHGQGSGGLWLVWLNAGLLLRLGGYELALLDAYTDGRSNHRDWSLRQLHQLFGLADRAKLRAAGEPLPGPGPYTLYRGVAGPARHRRVRGYSWTATFEKAQWFAHRYASGVLQMLTEPQVYRLVVPERAILAYINERKEQEFLVQVPSRLRPERCA